MHTQGTIRALGGTRLGWEPGLHWLRAHPPAPGCGPTELSTARGYLLVPSSFPLVPLFSLSSTRDGDRRVVCPLLCDGMQGAATPHRVLVWNCLSPPMPYCWLNLPLQLPRKALSPPHEYFLQPRPLWGAAVPPLRMGDDVMSSPPELFFAFLQGFPPAAAPASSAFLLLPKCLHCFPRSAVFL